MTGRRLSLSINPENDAQAAKAREEVFARTMPPGIGDDDFGMSFQGQQAAEGVSPALIFSRSFHQNTPREARVNIARAEVIKRAFTRLETKEQSFEENP